MVARVRSRRSAAGDEPARKSARSSRKNGANSKEVKGGRRRGGLFSISKKPEKKPTSPAEIACTFLGRLRVPEGPLAGRKMVLGPFQRQFVHGALQPDCNVACLSVARGNAKSALAGGLGLGALIGEWDKQPRREIIIAARTQQQAKVGWQFAAGFARSLPTKIQSQLVFRRGPRLEIEYTGGGGGHVLQVLPADAKTSLGGAPTLVIEDERGSWARDRGDELEHALLSGLGKRGGRALIISTSAPDDSHPFSKWLDEEQEGVYRQEHRPPPGLPADDLESLLIANPGSAHGIGAGAEWLQAQARRAIARGGSALTSFRLYNRNERISGESRDVLLTVDEWLSCETAELPPREGSCVIGVDLGGSSSMTAAAFYWSEHRAGWNVAAGFPIPTHAARPRSGRWRRWVATSRCPQGRGELA